jgi:L-glyceraldehyde 3-phosphate reductase
MGLEYVDIFYSHRFDPETPLEETMGALAAAISQGKALYVGHLVVLGEKTREAEAILARARHALLIHQPSYSLLNRWIEAELLGQRSATSASAASLLAARPGRAHRQYLDGIPEGSRASEPGRCRRTSSARRRWPRYAP